MAKKRKEPRKKAKKSWEKIVEWGKEFWVWTFNALAWTYKAILYELLALRENWAELVSNSKWKKEWVTKKEREEYKRKSEEHSRKAKAYREKEKEKVGKANQGAKQAMKWWWKAIKNIWKWGYYVIDTWDDFLGEKIEEKQIEKWKHPGKLWKVLRDNITKIAFLLSSIIYWWYKTTQISEDKQEDSIEIVKWLPEEAQELKDFFKSPDVLEDLKSSWKAWQDKWKNRYLWEDDAWNNMRNGFWFAERKKVIDWLCRMIESWHLEMVLEKADKAWVPRQCVFLALAESWWQAGANSWVAWWYRQFTEDSGKRFWVIDNQWNDYRSDPEKSTDAAMKHLQENYKIVCNYAKQLWYKLSESDKWIFAFHMYNWSPRLVRRWMIACKWDANKYSEKLVAKTTENNNYVPRILGIQDALYTIFKENWYDINKVKAVCLNQRVVKKTEADTMYEEFIKMEKSLALEEKLQKLNEVKEKYEEEYRAWIISKNYYEWAIRVISEAIVSENEEEEEDDEE